MPFVSPMTEHESGPLVQVQVAPPGDAVTMYEVTPPPVSAGALHESVTCPLPGVAASPVGAPGTARMASETLGDVAAVKPPASVIAAEMVHVPVAINATTPVVELTVQTEVVALVNVIVPIVLPRDGVATNVGGVPLRA